MCEQRPRPKGKFACLPCWAALPPSLQRRIWANARLPFHDRAYGIQPLIEEARIVLGDPAGG